MLEIKIRQFRKQNGYSQRDLAELLGVSVRTIGRWEQGNVKPSIEELKKLAEITGMSESELLRDDGDSLKQTEESVLNRISESVDNLVTGQDTINKAIVSSRDEFQARQTELIRELQSQNAELLKKLEDNERKQESQNEIIKQRRIKIAVMISLAVIVILLVAAFLWYAANFGTNPDELLAGQPVVQKTN